jgi:hypothetical protein
MVAALVAAPFAIFGLPAMAGVTWLVSDNLIQNFPLRVLVGIDLRHGHAPVWDPYLWSGSPLLSGFNAGAAYPATWFFSILPGAFAWVVNQALVQVVAALGMVVLLRVLGRSWTASGLGAVAFSYGGFMAAQSVHIDVIEAGAWLPWAFAALDRLAHRPEGRSATPWVAILGASIGLMGLSGAAEPILDGGVALGLYALWLFWKNPAHRWAIGLGVVAGVVLGLALAGAQLVPGALIQEQSQRAVHNYQFFTSGSMNKSLTVLGLNPFVLGTSGTFPTHFFATYSLPEVSSYIGIMPIMGVVGLLARRHRRHAESPQWWIWYAIAALGLVLTWGGFTPVGHVFFHLPLFNRQRLLARNLLEVDLAVAVLFATWVDHMLLSASPERSTAGSTPTAPDVRVEPPGPLPRWGRRLVGPGGWHSDVVLPLIPALAVIGLQVVLLAGGTWFPHFLHVPGRVTRSSLWPLVAFLTLPSAIATWAMWLVLRRQQLARRMPGLVAVLLIADLLLFNGFTQGAPDPVGATADSASANALASFVAAQGPGPAGENHRVALFDPDRYYSVQAERIGQPDLTILRDLGSVQGYGAVVDANYDRATATHTQLNMNPAALADGTFAQLDLGVLVTVPEYFLHLVVAAPGSPHSAVAGVTAMPPVGPTPGAPADTSTPPPTPAGDYQYAPTPAPTVYLAPGHAHTQYFGTVLSVTSVSVPVASGSGDLRVGLLSPDGRRTAWIGSTAARLGAVTVSAPSATSSSGIVLEVSAPAGAGAVSPGGRSEPTDAFDAGAALVRTAGQGTYRVDGSLRDSVTSPRWRYGGRIGVFSIFTQPSATGRAWVQHGGPHATAHVVSSMPWGDETVRVTTARPATLVRSEQYATGWQATVTTTGGPKRKSHHPTTVRQHGLIQSVAVPAGASLVHFTYRPHRVLEGFAASAVGFIVAVGLLAWPVVRRRRRAFGARPPAAR